jgi:Ubiquitin family
MLSGRPQRRVDARTIPAPVATGGSGQSSTDLGRQSNDLKKGSGFVARHGYYVYITTLTGKTIAVRVNGLDTIHKVKEKVKAEEGIPTDQLAYGHSLDDERTVAEYEIKRHSRLQLILCPPRYTVFVKILDGESITGTIVNLSVRASETIFNVKAKSREAAHIPIDQQSLTFHGQLLNNGRSLESYDIKGESTIRLILLKLRYNILLKLLDGKTIIVNVRGHETIYDVKAKIKDAEGIPIFQQRIVLHGRQLEDIHTVDDYNITTESELYLVLRLFE